MDKPKCFTVPLLEKYFDRYGLEDLQDALKAMTHALACANQAKMEEQAKSISGMVSRLEKRIAELSPPSEAPEEPVDAVQNEVEVKDEPKVEEPPTEVQAETLRKAVDGAMKRGRRG